MSGVGAFVVEFAADAPVVVDFVFEFEEGAAFAEFAFVPVGAEEGFARQAQVAAVFREWQAVRVGGVVLVLVVAAEGEFGVVAQFLVEYAVEQAVFAIDVALEAVVVFADGNDAAAQAPWFVQRAGDVAGGAYFAKAVGNGIGADLRVVGRLFAHGVDGAARFAVRLSQPGRAAHHFDVVVQRQVHLLFRVAEGVAGHARRADGGADAVFFDLLDKKAARLVHGAGAVAGDVHPGGGAQRVFDGGQPLVVELRFGDDADGLRRFARREGEAGGGAHRRCGVGIDVFGAGVVAVALDSDGLQVLAFLRVSMAGKEDGGRERGGLGRVVHGGSPLRVWRDEMSFG